MKSIQTPDELRKFINLLGLCSKCVYFHPTTEICNDRNLQERLKLFEIDPKLHKKLLKEN